MPLIFSNWKIEPNSKFWWIVLNYIGSINLHNRVLNSILSGKLAKLIKWSQMRCDFTGLSLTVFFTVDTALQQRLGKNSPSFLLVIRKNSKLLLKIKFNFCKWSRIKKSCIKEMTTAFTWRLLVEVTFQNLWPLFYLRLHRYHTSGSEPFITAEDPVKKGWSLFTLGNRIGQPAAQWCHPIKSLLGSCWPIIPLVSPFPVSGVPSTLSFC